MRSEIRSLKKVGTWSFVDLPKGQRFIQTKWVFDLKRDEDGKIVRYKAPLVAKGFTKILGTEISEVFALVSGYTTVRFILALWVKHGWKRRQIYVKNAFANALLLEEIYIEQPPICKNERHERKIFKLNKALYDLKQVYREWNIYFYKSLMSMRLEQGQADMTLYGLKKDGDFILLLTDVDDILILSNTREMRDKVVKQFDNKFEIRESK